ncbi:long-chain-fatty-acid--CoA ligase [Streptomyces sp. NPDC087908]|uniref:long-chain-fatty-acid--CoA ligase n=1 Tax=unclassified Streptomyces TaxID=2593676 RepID=UPI0011CDC986|nr:long-chain-fatty-acid--CoA ligase [Streptomyces sp. adm13(2018)]TXS15743.1 long-chain-fatty-acid--CoA ligase [Streptomyces sp. adm13(2018)]
MKSTMQDRELLVRDLLGHGQRVYADSRVIRCADGRAERSVQTFAEIAAQAEQLAAALARLGVQLGERVATLAWNTPEHLVAYLAVPSMGAVLHTLNLRLHPDQLGYIVEHAEDAVLLVDATLQDMLRPLAGRLGGVRHVVVIGGAPEVELPGHIAVHRWDELLAAERPGYVWPDLDEREAAALCYTTGTTGDPKGVAYSHRSISLHTLGVSGGSGFAMHDGDRVLPIVPMFHANAWGWPYSAWLAGADLIMNGPQLHTPDLARIINEERPTAVAAICTIWNSLVHHGEQHPLDLGAVRLAGCGGATPPRALLQRLKDRYGVRLIQGWGLTETSPLATFAVPPHGTPDEEEVGWLAKSGRVMPYVDVRLIGEDGTEQPWDGTSVGELELRGPWVTGSYHNTPDSADRFHDGWLRTGDLGVIEPGGWVVVSDRLKDGIKSGGEWISTIELENAIIEHPAVLEAIVVGVPDPRWEERPLACVSLVPGGEVDGAGLREFLTGRVARWWVPERWSFVDAVPKTSVGKYDKRAVRSRYAEGTLDVWTPAPGAPGPQTAEGPRTAGEPGAAGTGATPGTPAP